MRHLLKGKLVYEHAGRPAWTMCDVILDDSEDETRPTKLIALFTQLLGHQGVSITNSVESAAKAFCEDRNVWPDQVVFIERYEHSPDDLDQIILDERLENPRWTRLSREKADNILATLRVAV